MSDVLIVEDEQVTAMEIWEMVQELGYEPMEPITTGEKMVEKAADQKPDLMLVDIRLEGDVDGIEAVERIQANQDIPVIYVTAHSDEETRKKAKQTMPKGYLVKPVTKSDLRSSIEKALKS